MLLYYVIISRTCYVFDYYLKILRILFCFVIALVPSDICFVFDYFVGTPALWFMFEYDVTISSTGLIITLLPRELCFLFYYYTNISRTLFCVQLLR